MINQAPNPSHSPADHESSVGHDAPPVQHALETITSEFKIIDELASDGYHCGDSHRLTKPGAEYNWLIYRCRDRERKELFDVLAFHTQECAAAWIIQQKADDGTLRRSAKSLAELTSKPEAYEFKHGNPAEYDTMAPFSEDLWAELEQKIQPPLVRPA